MVNFEERRLIPAEIAGHRASLQELMPPAAMRDCVEELSRIVGRHFFTQAGLEFLRDAWTAAQIAMRLEADLVRLWPEERPDFETITRGVSRLYEVVEADRPGRRRGDEYKTREPGRVRDYPVEEVRANAANAPAMLATAARSKAAGGYDPSCTLVILLNLMEFGWHREEIEAAMEDATEPAHGAFREILILWQDRLYSFGRNRRAA